MSAAGTATAAATVRHRPSWWAAGWVAAGCFIALSVVAELRSIARPDIGFLLYAAARLLDGAKLYVDIVEINPPLIIALNVPPVLVARWLGVSDILVYRLGFTAILCAALALIWRALGRAVGNERPGLRMAVFAACAFVLFPLSAQDFGQREHLLLALILPYLLSAAGRASGRNPSRREATLIGVLTGIAFALKPYFLLLWIAVEFFFLRRDWRSGRWRVMPESVAIALLLASYAAIVALCTPEYIQFVMMVGAAYGQFLYDSFFHLLATGPGAPLVWIALLAYAALRGQARHPRLWEFLAIGLVTCFLGGALQQKGLRYHFYPAFALAVVLLGVVALDVEQPLRSFVQRIYRAIALSLAITSVVVVVVENVGAALEAQSNKSDREFLAFVRTVHGRADGGSIFVMSHHIGSLYPLVNYSGVRSASRFPQLWMVAASYMDDLKAGRPLHFHDRAAMSPTERYLNDAVAADLKRNRPTLIIVLRHARDLPVNGYRRIDYLAYFGRDPRIRRILDEYEWVANVGEYALYRRIGPGQARVGPAPAAEPGTLDVMRADRGGLRLQVADPAFLLRAIVFLIVTALVVLGARADARPADRA